MKKLGFGLMRLPVTSEENMEVDIVKSQELIDYYMQQGYNYFDTAYPYLKGNSEKSVKELLVNKYPRDSFILASKLPIFILENSQQMEDIFKEQLDRCGVEYFDYYMLHNVSSKHIDKFTKIDSFGFIKQKKEEGKIKHIGISSHDTAEFLENILMEHPEIEFVQLQLNYLDWDDEIIQARKCYNIATKYNKPVIIMEGLKGGALTKFDPSIEKIFKNYSDNSISSWSFRFNLSLENILVILSGMNNLGDLKENIEIFEEFRKLSNDEYNIIEKVVKKLNDAPAIKCTKCNYCLEHCPMNILIPKFFEIYNSRNILQESNTLTMYYNNLVSQSDSTATDCIKCNRCVEYCPQSIDIPKELEKVVKSFESN